MSGPSPRLSALAALSVLAAASFGGVLTGGGAAGAAGPAAEPAPGAVRELAAAPAARVVWVPAGSFLMGSPADEPGRDRYESPPTRVELTRGFWMWQTEVTQRQFEALLGYNPSRFPQCGPDCPVEWLNSDEAALFCNTLSRKEGLPECYECRDQDGTSYCTPQPRYAPGGAAGWSACPGWRLPTEAEWEYAARAGSGTAVYGGPLPFLGLRNAPGLDDLATYGGNCRADYAGGYDTVRWVEMQAPAERCGPQPVGRKRPNAWNLHDMLGNVAEWCADWWAERAPERDVDPVGAPEGQWRVMRGGSWFDLARYVRAAARFCFEPENRFPSLGFRVVRTGP